MKTLTAAIQFGSSRICAAAAWIDDKTGLYEVASIECVSTDGCIRHGCVVNVEETAVRIKSLMKKLSNRVKAAGSGDLDAAYVGICGLSMHAMKYRPSMPMGEESTISKEVCQQLRDMSMELSVPGHDILGLYSNGEHIADQLAEADHQLIVAESRLQQGIRTAMERAKMRVAGVFATPLLLGDILLAEEKQRGCLLIDLGAQLTTISIWADGGLRMLKVLPIGGESVTRDIASKGLRTEDAESLKTSWSDASRPKAEDERSLTQSVNLTANELNIIVASRLEELIDNINNQVKQAGFKGRLEGGCVLTGGAAIQKGLTSLLSKRLEITKISTRSCNRIRFSSSEKKPNLASLMSMLPYCTESCEALPEKPAASTLANGTATTTAAPPTVAPSSTTRTTPRNSSFGQSIRKEVGGFFTDLFSGMDE